MSKIDPEEYQKRLDRLTDIFTEIAEHAQDQSLTRCPYKNKHDHCTAQFGCRNQRKVSRTGKLLICGGDDKIDYRTAWETAPGEGERVRGEIAEISGVERVRRGDTLFDRADEIALKVPTSCGRMGICHECIVEVRDGADALGPRTEAESFLSGDFRLACQALILDADARIDFTPLRRAPQILTQTRANAVALDPAITRAEDQVLCDGEVVGPYRGALYGLAIDLGTTTIVFELVDLQSGETLEQVAIENPQRFGGSDVMSRISYDGKHKRELWQALVKTLNQEIAALASRRGFNPEQIYEIVVAGNSTMRDILFRIDVQSIGQKPYKSKIEDEFRSGARDTTSLTVPARRLALSTTPKARVQSLPLIASHVGADTAAALLAIDMDKRDETIMLVDVGTNTEVVIRHKGRIVAASCPAGPAFEGGGFVRYGMPGADGAIDHARWNGAAFDVSTIGGGPSQGMCGSGLIDILSELRRHELMTPKGVFADRRAKEIPIAERITLSRLDVSNLAQAKAANFCGQLIAMRALGLSPSDIDVLYLAGGFANYVNAANAVEIGFLAPVPLDRIEKIGNAAVQGAREALLSRARRRDIEAFVRTIEHIELETTPDFFELFVEGCQMKPMPQILPKAIPNAH